MRDDEVTELLRSQDGVVARHQLRELEVTDNDIERKLRRRDWSRVHHGIYVDHTGPLTWSQRAWAAVLCYSPAALAGRSALRAWKVRNHHQGDDEPVHVCVDSSRTVRGRPGIKVERISGWDEKCLVNLSPPRLRIEHALVAVASARSSQDEALAVLADAVQSGRTTVSRLVSALAGRPRLRHRALLLQILEDVQTGAYSVLEHRYLVHVERPHGLPTAARQRRVSSGKSAAFRDVDYVETATVVELDGRLGHEEATEPGLPGRRPRYILGVRCRGCSRVRHRTRGRLSLTFVTA
jgi:hypothetical protein